MFLTSKSAISQVYRNVLRFLRISSNNNTEWCEIRWPLKPASIHSYCDRLQAEYKLEGSERMNSFLIQEVRLYKTRATPRHEYVSLKVLSPNQKIFFLSVERGQGEIVEGIASVRDTNTSHTDNNTQAQPGGSALSPESVPLPPSHSLSLSDTITSVSISESSPPSPSSSSTIVTSRVVPTFWRSKPDDKVTVLNSTGKNRSDEVFRILTFSDPLAPTATSSLAPGLPLFKLVVLANTLHCMQREQLLVTGNCYFYAGTIVKVLEEVYQPAVVVVTTELNEVDKKWGLSWLKKQKRREFKAGTWNGIGIYAGEKIDTIPLRECFEENLASFVEPIEEHEDNLKAKELRLQQAEAEIDRLKRLLEQIQKQQQDVLADV